ncbi:MAG TPA: MoaD/ThiS family protein [Pseudonocardiaceae bacterium]|jgi:molybdopterin converting factor small subunit|nr:MoaD/ThiS family protein [Pseudonocardiaceae bacterium]
MAEVEPVAAISVRVRYFAGARSAAGVAEERVDVGERASVADVLTLLRERRGAQLSTVLTACSFLLNGVAVRDPATTVSAPADLDVLPPFAGG